MTTNNPTPEPDTPSAADDELREEVNEQILDCLNTSFNGGKLNPLGRDFEDETVDNIMRLIHSARQSEREANIVEELEQIVALLTAPNVRSRDKVKATMSYIDYRLNKQLNQWQDIEIVTRYEKGKPNLYSMDNGITWETQDKFNQSKEADI